MAHTQDIGVAIRDSLVMLDAVETFDWTCSDPPGDVRGDVEIVIDDTDYNNLIVSTSDGQRFRISVVSIG